MNEFLTQKLLRIGYGLVQLDQADYRAFQFAEEQFHNTRQVMRVFLFVQ